MLPPKIPKAIPANAKEKVIVLCQSIKPITESMPPIAAPTSIPISVKLYPSIPVFPPNTPYSLPYNFLDKYFDIPIFLALYLCKLDDILIRRCS